MNFEVWRVIFQFVAGCQSSIVNQIKYSIRTIVSLSPIDSKASLEVWHRQTT